MGILSQLIIYIDQMNRAVVQNSFESIIRSFNLRPEKRFEGYSVKSAKIFSGCTLIFLGCRHTKGYICQKGSHTFFQDNVIN